MECFEKASLLLAWAEDADQGLSAKKSVADPGEWAPCVATLLICFLQMQNHHIGFLCSGIQVMFGLTSEYVHDAFAFCARAAEQKFSEAVVFSVQFCKPISVYQLQHPAISVTEDQSLNFHMTSSAVREDTMARAYQFLYQPFIRGRIGVWCRAFTHDVNPLLRWNGGKTGDFPLKVIGLHVHCRAVFRARYLRFSDGLEPHINFWFEDDDSILGVLVVDGVRVLSRQNLSFKLELVTIL